MRKVRVVLCLVIVSLLVTGNAALANEQYNKMMEAIEAWLQSNPSRDFRSAEAEQAFHWKVKLEGFDYDMRAEQWLFYQELLQEIGDKEFVYENYRYNAKSIRAKMLEQFPFWTEKKDLLPHPESVFVDMYDWYVDNIAGKKEQAHWLNLFMSFISSANDDTVCRINDVRTGLLDEIVLQYLAICEVFLTSMRSEIHNIDYVYSTLQIFASTQDPTDRILSPLLGFCENAAPYLDSETKKRIVKFVVPEYADKDIAVKIYATLMK